MVRPDLTFGRPPGVSAPGGPFDPQTETESHLGTSKRYLRPNWSSIAFLAGLAGALRPGIAQARPRRTDRRRRGWTVWRRELRVTPTSSARSLAQQRRRILSRRCACRQPAGQQADADQDRRGARERDGVARLDVEQQRADELRRPQAQDDADRGADRQKHRSRGGGRVAPRRRHWRPGPCARRSRTCGG